MIAAFFLTTFLLALSIDIAAKPVLERKSPTKMPLRRRILANHSVVEQDQRRGKFLRSAPGSYENDVDSDLILRSGSISPDNIEANNEANSGCFIVTVGVGSPTTYCK
jgi:hypothetical protein